MIRASKRAGVSTCRFGGRAALVCSAALMMLSAAAWGAETSVQKVDQTPQPWVTISLGTLGVPSIPPAFLQVGSSMLTLHMVDDTHMLLTFSSRGLVPRVPDDPPDDEDRMVAAELVELPTGRILARADWHMHDHSRYLWRLGKGRFLVRTRHDLFVITPLARLKTADPLRPMRFPTREGMPLAVVVSPDKGIVTVETVAPQKKGSVDAGAGGLIVTDPRPTVMIDFFRLTGGDAPGAPMTVKLSGNVTSPAPLVLPMDADGYLWPTDAKHGQWPVSFNEFGGHEVKITNVNSSCPPRLQMVSRFEFLAFTCKGSDARVNVKSYGMDGHETWEETLSGTYGMPELAYAPEAGRFALSRIMSPSGDLNFGQVIPEGATQEMRVYQTESGELLLKVPTTPVTRYAENFDLTEDGMVAAVVNAGVIQVYKLPTPSAQDMKDLTEAKSFSPPLSEAPVSFARLASHGSEESGSDSSSAGANMAAAMKPDVGSSPGLGAGGGGIAPPAPTAPALGSANAPDANQGDVAVAPPGAEVTKPSAGGDPASSTTGITDAEAMAVMAKTAPATKAQATAQTDASVQPAVQSADAAAKDGSGDAETGPRKPPTLLEPGENVEKVKPPQNQQQSQQQQSRSQ
jgi:hypothetical protein